MHLGRGRGRLSQVGTLSETCSFLLTKWILCGSALETRIAMSRLIAMIPRNYEAPSIRALYFDFDCEDNWNAVKEDVLYANVTS